MLDPTEGLIMVLSCKLRKKVQDRVTTFVQNRWSLASTEDEIKAALLQRDAIIATAADANRDLTDEERVAVRSIEKEFIAVKRGLSQVHYDQWEHARQAMGKIKKARFDADLIQRGLLLDRDTVREYRKKNKFQMVAARTAG
jgi:hypothetical protein